MTEHAGGLAAKLAEVMATVERIAKSGHNTNFNYDFVREADVLAAIRKELSQRKVAFIPFLEEALPGRDVPTRSGTIHITEQTYRFDFIDGDSGQVISGRVRAEGMDGQDKGSNKALTAAVKYFLLKTFLIPTGDDPDGDEVRHHSPREERIPNAPPAAPPPSGRPPVPTAGGALTDAQYDLVLTAGRTAKKTNPNQYTAFELWLAAEFGGWGEFVQHGAGRVDDAIKILTTKTVDPIGAAPAGRPR